jgi:hypothetical protein
LTACASPEAAVEPVVQAGQLGGLSADFSDAMPITSQLAAGTVAIENGENAVDEEQAAKLLPLWQAYSALVAAGSTADAELDGLTSQIERGMTDAQIAEIAALQLTNTKLQEMIAAGEIQLGRGGRGGQGGGQGEGGQGGGGQGGGGQGGGGQGGGGQGGIGGLTPDEIAARQAERIEAAGGADAFFAQQVSGAVVRLLNIKVNGEPAQQGGGNPFGIATEIVAAALDMSVEELVAAAEGEGKSIQAIIEEKGGDLDAIKTTLEEALTETGAARNGDLAGFIENYLASNGVGRGRGGENNNGNGNADG